MTQSSTTIAAIVLSTSIIGGGGAALAQGGSYGSAGGAAAALGFTASPPIAQNSNVRAVAEPAVEPAATGSVARRDRTWTRLRRR